MPLESLYQQLVSKKAGERLPSLYEQSSDPTLSIREDLSCLEQDVELRIEKLVLVCQAMWSLIEEKTDLCEEDLAQRIEELEVQDEQLSKEIVKCPDCGGAISRKFGRCQSCGYEL